MSLFEFLNPVDSSTAVSSVVRKSGPVAYPSPPGYKPASVPTPGSLQASASSSSSVREAGGSGSSDEAKRVELTRKKVAQLAKSPVQKIFMTGIMAYMTGSGIHIMTLLMLGMMLMQCVSPIFSVNKAFSQFEGTGVPLLFAKLQFVALHLVGVGIMCYKGYMMGLLRLGATQYLIPHPDPSVSASWLH